MEPPLPPTPRPIQTRSLDLAALSLYLFQYGGQGLLLAKVGVEGGYLGANRYSIPFLRKQKLGN